MIVAYTPLCTDEISTRQENGEGTYKVCAEVATKFPLEPMLAAAMTWTAQPQSIDATEAITPVVFASVHIVQVGTEHVRGD